MAEGVEDLDLGGGQLGRVAPQAVELRCRVGGLGWIWLGRVGWWM